MAELTEQETLKLQLIVLDHLQAEKYLDETASSLISACSRKKMRCKTLYKSIPLKTPSNPENFIGYQQPDPEAFEDPMIVAILASLNIKRSTTEEEGHYEKLMESGNLYDLLKNLSHDGHHHVDSLLDLIEHTKPRYDWTLVFILGAITSAGLGALADSNRQFLAAISQWFSETFPVVVTWFGRTFSVLRNIPLLGIIVNGLILTWNWYSTFTNGTTTTPKKLQELFFKTLTSGLTISAYTLAFLAGGIITTPAALLFVSSSASKVIQGVYNWYKNAKPIQPARGISWEVQSEYLRAENLHQRSKNFALVKIGAAIFTTIAVAVWDFGPHGLVFTALCVAFISMTALTEWSILSRIKESADEQLQSDIDGNKITRTTIVRPALSDVSRVNDQQRELNRERQRLEEEAVQLALRESHLEDQKRGLAELITAFGGQIRESSTSILSRLNAMRSFSELAPAPANEEELREERHFPSPLEPRPSAANRYNNSLSASPYEGDDEDDDDDEDARSNTFWQK